MAEFKFNFEVEDCEEETDMVSSESDLKPFSQLPGVHQARELLIPSTLVSILSSQVEETVTSDGNLRMKHVKESYVEQKLRGQQQASSCDIIRAAESHSDLIPSVYEGGLKIWECCLDLVQYLSQIGASFQGKRVLEIGCGAGLPGIFALLRGAQVHFQDYNDDVVEHVTIPNVLLNLGQLSEGERIVDFSPERDPETKSASPERDPETNSLSPERDPESPGVKHKKCEGVGDFSPERYPETKSPIPERDPETNSPSPERKCRFFSGDWGSLVDFINPQKLEEMMYDVILTSETIYCVESHDKLYRLIKAHLRKPCGVAYIAAKTYYFGVGGGTRGFENLVRMDGVFDISVCKTYSDGVQREILCMRCMEGKNSKDGDS